MISYSLFIQNLLEKERKNKNYFWNKLKYINKLFKNIIFAISEANCYFLSFLSEAAITFEIKKFIYLKN